MRLGHGRDGMLLHVPLGAWTGSLALSVLYGRSWLPADWADWHVDGGATLKAALADADVQGSGLISVEGLEQVTPQPPA